MQVVGYLCSYSSSVSSLLSLQNQLSSPSQHVSDTAEHAYFLPLLSKIPPPRSSFLNKISRYRHNSYTYFKATDDHLGSSCRSPTCSSRSTLLTSFVEVIAQGAGKGTQSDWLLEKWDIETIVVGQLLRNEIVKGSELGKFAEKKMKAGGEF